MRLGFAVKVLGQEGLKSNDSRRWQNSPHLRVSIEYLHKIFDYLAETRISMYRISSDFAPYLTHPDLPQFHNQLKEAETDLVALGKRAREMNLRLSFHPSQYIVLNSPSERITETSLRDFAAQADMLDIMGCGDEAVVVTHVGGVYGDPEGAMRRFAENHAKLSEPARRRLVLENDDVSWGVRDVLKLHEATGIRCIFDHQHHTCINPDGRSHEDACCAILGTWPEDQRPKIHYSSPRQEARTIMRRDKASGKRVAHEAPALLSQHADYVDETVFIPFARAVKQACSREFDVMVEAKAKDLAVLQLRRALEGLPDFTVE